MPLCCCFFPANILRIEVIVWVNIMFRATLLGKAWQKNRRLDSGDDRYRIAGNCARRRRRATAAVARPTRPWRSRASWFVGFDAHGERGAYKTGESLEGSPPSKRRFRKEKEGNALVQPAGETCDAMCGERFQSERGTIRSNLQACLSRFLRPAGNAPATLEVSIEPVAHDVTEGTIHGISCRPAQLGV